MGLLEKRKCLVFQKALGVVPVPLLLPLLAFMNLNPGKFALVAFSVCLLWSCAQTGPPLPPSLELPKPPSDLRASRKGNVVTLTWSEPVRSTDRQSIRYLGPTRVCRSLGSEMTTCPAPVIEIAPAGSRPTSSSGFTEPKRLVYADTLPPELEQQNPAGDVVYAVEVLNRDGRNAGLSNRVRVPAAPTLSAPSNFAADLTGDGVSLTWTSIGESTDSAEIRHRYRIYRHDDSSGKDMVIGETPLGVAGLAHFLDSSFEWEKSYTYRITLLTIVTRGTSEAQIEGDDSGSLRVLAHDVFPPAVPSGLQAVYSGEGQKPFVDLIWSPVTNLDLAGYHVYRRESLGSARSLDSDLVKSPSYRDHSVEPGRTYVYSVSAVDMRGNESARSEETTETVPPNP